MKKLICLVLMLIMMFSLAACGQKQSKITSLLYSDYYKGANDFEIIEPHLNNYFNSILTAYDNSDKKSLRSFKLPASYEEAQAALSVLAQSKTDLSAILDLDDNERDEVLKSSLAKLKLLEPYHRIEVMLSSKNVLLEADKNVIDKEWFSELNKYVWDAIDEYRRGTGE